MDRLQVLVDAILNLKDTTASKEEIKKGLPALNAQLATDKSARVNIVGQLDYIRTKNAIEAQLKDISKGLKIDVSGINISKIAGGVTGQTQKDISQQIFNSDKLDKEGRKYFTKTTNILDQVKSYYQKNGALSVDISSIEKSNGQIKSFTASVESATGVIKKFNFERGKIDTGGSKVNYGFVQTDSLKSIDKNAGANLKSTLNYLNKIDQKIMTIQSHSTKQANPLKEGTQFYDNYNNKLTETVNKINNITSANKTLSTEQKNEINTLVKSLELYAKEQQKLAYPPMISSTDISAQIKNATSSLTTLEQRWKNQGILTGEFKAKVDQLKVSLSQVGNADGLKAYNSALQNVKNQAGLLIAQNTTLDEKIKKLNTDMIAFANANQKAIMSTKVNSQGKTFAQELADLQLQLSKCENPAQYRRIAANFRSIQSEVKALGLSGNTILGGLWDKIKRFAGWMGITTVVSRAVKGLRNMINEIVELDTALVDLKKTSDATESQLKAFYYVANDMAKALGISTVAVVQATSEWSRLGYSISKATKLAKNTAIFKAISPEMTTEQATDGLVAAIKAYGIGVEDTLDGIISKVNVLGNKFAVNNQDVIEVITRSASAMASANNSFEQTAALGVSATEIVRDSASVGTALKTISMRIRAMDEETEQYDETLKTIKGDIYDLTGVSIMSDSDTYRSTYDILKDISLVWDNLTDKAKAQTLESLFGKRQANIGSAILSNFESAERALDEMANSQGGALKEMEIIYDSIEYKANRFKESLTGIAQSSITQDFLKNVIDLGTKFLELLNNVIDKIGVLPTLIGGIGSAIMIGKSFNNTGGDKMISLGICPSYTSGNTEQIYAEMVA
jgi:TP901 family phage tail tape measure protein